MGGTVGTVAEGMGGMGEGMGGGMGAGGTDKEGCKLACMDSIDDRT